MKRTIFVASILLLTSSAAVAQNYGLPELHTINSVTLSPNYGCRSQEDFSRGYEKTALFLSDYSKRMNAPDLLFNGACKSEDYLEASTEGDEMPSIAHSGTDITHEDHSH